MTTTSNTVRLDDLLVPNFGEGYCVYFVRQEKGDLIAEFYVAYNNAKNPAYAAIVSNESMKADAIDLLATQLQGESLLPYYGSANKIIFEKKLKDRKLTFRTFSYPEQDLFREAYLLARDRQIVHSWLG
jgi:hypothetical protein